MKIKVSFIADVDLTGKIDDDAGEPSLRDIYHDLATDLKAYLEADNYENVESIHVTEI